MFERICYYFLEFNDFFEMSDVARLTGEFSSRRIIPTRHRELDRPCRPTLIALLIMPRETLEPLFFSFFGRIRACVEKKR